MMVQAANVVVDGFVFSGNQNGWGLRTEGESGAIDYGGYRIRNNIFTGNRVGMYLRDGRDTVVSNNLFHDSGAPGSAEPNGHGIYADDSAIDVTISDNQFRENAMSLSLVPGPGDDAANVSYSRNVSINDAHGVNFNGVDGLDIIDNTMRGGAEGAISLVGSGLDNVLVEGNRITEKGSYGINLNTYGASENGKVTIRENTILRTRATGSGAGMAITLANNSISEPLTIVKNRIVDSAKIGLRNRETTKVDARRNWWGCNLGPGTEGCDSVVAEDSGLIPAFAPWLTLSLSLRDTTPPVPAGGSATLFARVANLSVGGLANGPFFRRGPRQVRLRAGRWHPEPGHHYAEQQRGHRHVRVHRRPAADRMVRHRRPSDRPALQPGLTRHPGLTRSPPGLTRPLCRPDRCAVRHHADPAPTGGDHHRRWSTAAPRSPAGCGSARARRRS